MTIENLNVEQPENTRKPGRPRKVKGLTKWQKGQSGNPNGRPPALTSITKAIRNVMNVEATIEVGKVKYTGTYAEILAKRIVELAVTKGDSQLIKLIVDRIDGRLIDNKKDTPPGQAGRGNIVFNYSSVDNAGDVENAPAPAPEDEREHLNNDNESNSKYVLANISGENRGNFEANVEETEAKIEPVNVVVKREPEAEITRRKSRVY